LEYFDRWAKASGWLKEKHDSNGLNFFWRPLEEMAEGEELRVARETEEKKTEGPEISEAEAQKIVIDSVSERQKEAHEHLKKIEEQKQWDDAHRDEI